MQHKSVFAENMACRCHAAKAERGRLFACLCLLVALFYAFTALSGSFLTARAWAQEADDGSIIRDAEIESLVSDYAKPLLHAAGQRTDIRVIIIDDDSFNAFVDGARIFINSGALLQAETPNEIIGVLAHETGHLAGGHLFRLRDHLRRAQTLAVVGMLLGVGAGIAGGGAAGNGIIAGSQQIAMRSLLNYQRSEETIADRLAVTYLDATHQSAKGMLTTFQRFANAIALSGIKPDPYIQSHPLPQARIDALKDLAEKSPYYDKKDPPELQLRHDLARVKLAAYQSKLTVLHKLSKDPNSLPARYGMAISALKNGLPAAAIEKAQALIKSKPQNPYFHELLGDAYMKAGQADNAAASYKQAIALDSHKSPQLYISYGRALLASPKAANKNAAIAALQTALAREDDDPDAYNFLAMAYGQSGRPAMADLAAADMHYYSGDIAGARYFAGRAQQGLKRGSAAWLRAQDILAIAADAAKKRR